MMWAPGRRVRMGMSLALGFLAGIALLSVPALITPTDQALSPDTGDRLALESKFGDVLSAEPATGPTAGPAPTNTSSDTLALGLGLFLILLPASVLSFLSRRWAVRRLEQHWD